MNARQYGALTHETIAAALSFIDPFDRETWLRMGMAVKSELGDHGFDLWDNWSSGSSNYNQRDARQVWKSLKLRGAVTIGTLIHAALEAGFEFDDKAPRIDEDEILRREERRREEEQRQKENARLAIEEAVALWNDAKPLQGDGHPYLKRKGVASHGLKVGRWPLRNRDGEIYAHSENVLLIPIKNVAGKITSLQGIFAKRPDGYTNDKSNWKDGKKSGSFHLIGSIESGTLAFCEGYATGATIHEATGWAVAVCFDRTNIITVAEKMRPSLNGIALVVCSDNDQQTEGNPGLADATRASRILKARLFVPQFKDTSSNPTDFNDLQALEGIGEVKRQLDADIQIVANDNIPIQHFQPLGYDHESYFVFQCEKKQLVELSVSSMSEMGLIALAPLSYWEREFPKRGDGFNRREAADWLMRECIRRGIYDPSRVRGRGAWMDGGRVVFHLGGRLWVNGELIEVTDLQSNYVYELARSLPEPHAEPLSDEDGATLLEIAKQFRWTKPASAPLLAGWVALAPICGALRWRPHIWITGGAGCGKTTVLNDFVHRLMGGMDIFAQGNSTEAGIRQSLRCDAMPVLFDESEQNNEREASRVQNVLSLIRQASSESAASTLKGTATGDAMQFMIRSMFCLSSIQVGMKHQADYERLAVLALRPKHEDKNAADGWKWLSDQLHRLRMDETLPSRLFRRSLDLLPVTIENIRIFSEAAARKFGSQRDGDQFGTLLAGSWSLIHSSVATPEEAADLIDSYEWEEYRENAETDESQRALTALLESEIPLGKGGRLSVYQIVFNAVKDFSGNYGEMTQREANGILQNYGMKVVDNELLLSNNSTSLNHLIKDTPFAADIRGQLLRIPGAHRYEKSVRFAGVVSKSIAIPLRDFIE